MFSCLREFLLFILHVDVVRLVCQYHSQVIAWIVPSSVARLKGAKIPKGPVVPLQGSSAVQTNNPHIRAISG